MKLEFLRNIFQKYLQIKFHENPSTLEAALFHVYEQTDRHDEANSRFCNFADAPKKLAPTSK